MKKSILFFAVLFICSRTGYGAAGASPAKKQNEENVKKAMTTFSGEGSLSSENVDMQRSDDGSGMLFFEVGYEKVGEETAPRNAVKENQPQTQKYVKPDEVKKGDPDPALMLLGK